MTSLHYPPCDSGICRNRLCCARGHKYEWPELVGKKADVAKSVIEKENPFVTVVVLRPDQPQLTDFCCNRVYLLIDSHHNVSAAPIVGNRFRWPELVGQDAEAAISRIGKTNPLVTAVKTGPGQVITDDFCCNRVWLLADSNKKVVTLPLVG